VPLSTMMLMLLSFAAAIVFRRCRYFTPLIVAAYAADARHYAAFHFDFFDDVAALMMPCC